MSFFGQDYRIDRIGLGSDAYREADEPSALAEPVVLPLIHGVILHPPAVTGNEKFPQKGTKNHKTECPGKVSFRGLLCPFVAMNFIPANLREREGVFPGLRPSLIAEKQPSPGADVREVLGELQSGENGPGPCPPFALTIAFVPDLRPR